MRILLTGGSGQFGKAFLRQAAGRAVSAPGHAAFAIEDAAATDAVVARERPDWIVHAAAMTDVDGCERDPTRAEAVNALGCENLARAAARHGARMLLVSTDYVFDGEKPGGRYTEHDLTNPLSAYGRSKRDGELRAEAALPSLCIARTSVVFGPDRNNFVLWVRRSLREGRPVRAARDQWVTPTAADDLARQVLALVEAGAEGVFHTAGSERLSRLEMAQRIAAHDGLDPAPIEPVSMAELAWVARRPRDSSLDVSKVARLARPLQFDAALDTLGAAA
ncbi:MAG TPA: dTDP-4-dehydrorhamnose reductase [Candidatus Thermoplasmatota archaeon]|nr:dTDP-4-dehydrorhamnose reductase [Candidatus Thermoplasmatota archaeon]